MSNHAIELASLAQLRLRAFARLTGRHDPGDTRSNSSAALGVLYKLASSPATSADALALLHELQVHQVELELQDEELHRTRAELEASLARLSHLYDHAPAGCFTLDAESVMRELNLTGARLLGYERDALVGVPLTGFLERDGERVLRGAIQRLGTGSVTENCILQLKTREGAAIEVHAAASADSVAGQFLIAIMPCRGGRGA
jgi:PAS domain S-box-containing protein